MKRFPGKAAMMIKTSDVLAVLAETPLIVGIAHLTELNTSAVAAVVMIIGTPLLLGLAEMARRATEN